MCGKFTQMMSWGTLVELADLLAAPASAIETVTPMRYATVICRGQHGRAAVKMRWGFVPHWAAEPAAGPQHIHARSEDIETKRTFKDAFFNRRGLIAVANFNEGEDVSPSKRIQHVVTPKDGKPLAIAVIWDRWGEKHAGELLTFAMVTVPANTLISRITDRMPAVIAPGHWAAWLGEEEASLDQLKAMLKPFEGDCDMQPQQKPKKKPPAPRRDETPSLF